MGGVTTKVFEALQELENCDTLPPEVLSAIIKLKQDRINKIHPYTITAPKKDGQRFQTYVKTPSGRKKLSSASSEGLYACLDEHYFGGEHRSLETFFPEWLLRKEHSNISPRTIARYHQYWDKYYARTEFVKIPLVDLTPDIIEDFLFDSIRKYHLDKKALDNMKVIITQPLQIAMRNRWIDSDPMKYIKISSYSCESRTKHSDSSRIFLPSEKEKFFQELKREVEDYPDNTDCFAIQLLFKTGIRIGELCALRWSDINPTDNELHICRMETVGKDTTDRLRPVVVDHTKKKSSTGDRFIPLGDFEYRLFARVKAINQQNRFQDGDYIFVDEQGRTKIREIDNRIRKLCNRAGIEIKSAHDIRRTVASELYRNGVTVKQIQTFLGHQDIQTTYGYIYDYSEKQEAQEMVKKALENMNGLTLTQVI